MSGTPGLAPDAISNQDVAEVDCSGIDTTLSLSHKPNVAEGKFELNQKYLGRNADFHANGDWTTLRGNDADPDATIVGLIGKSEKTSSYYLRRRDSLVMLDKNQNEIKSQLNYTLKNVEAERAGEVAFAILQNYFLKNTVRVVDLNEKRVKSLSVK